MNDCEELENDSGPQGNLASTMKSCSTKNDSLTRFYDGMFGPNSMDAIDASCNTCKHFARKAMTSEEKAERNTFGMPGRCTKKNLPTVAWQRGIFCGFENESCYENRRTGLTSGQVAANNRALLAGLEVPFPGAEQAVKHA